MLPSPDTLKIMNKSLICCVSILVKKLHMYTEVWHFLLVWLPLVISEECLADCSELVDVYRIIPERKPFKNALSIVKTIGYSNAF